MTFDYELTLISVGSVLEMAEDVNITGGYDTRDLSTENELGDIIRKERRVDVLCDVQSVTRTEHYAAAAHGLIPDIVFIVNQYEYSGEKEVEFEGRRYKVMRVYRPKMSKGIDDFESIELICQGVVNYGTA